MLSVDLPRLQTPLRQLLDFSTHFFLFLLGDEDFLDQELGFASEEPNLVSIALVGFEWPHWYQWNDEATYGLESIHHGSRRMRVRHRS